MVPKTFWLYIQFSAFNVKCCICYNWWNFWEKFCKFYLDQDDVLDALREVKMKKMKTKKKGRPRGAETTVIRQPQAKKQRGFISKPKPSQISARWKRIGSYLNASQTRLMLLLLLMAQDFCQLMTCLALMRYQVQLTMKILIFIV